MADVARGHGGDAGGDPPPGGWRPWTHGEVSQPKKGRGKSTNQGLRKAFKNNGNRPFPIMFERGDQNTLQPVGDNKNYFIRLVGGLVGDIPKHYYSWADVPQEHKVSILPELEHYFDLRPHLHPDPNKCRVRAGIERLCADRYRDRKYKLKVGHFEENGGFDDPEQARRHPPAGMDELEWNQCIDFFVDPKNMSRSETNRLNRAQQRYPSLHGSSSYAASRHKKMEEEGQYPALTSTFYEMHSKSGQFVNTAAQEAYEEMQRIRTSATESSSDMNEQQIFSQVLGERRGHNRGRGRKLKGAASGSASTQPPNDQVYTKDQVDAMFASYNQQFAGMVEALRNANIPVPKFNPVGDEDDGEDEENDENDD